MEDTEYCSFVSTNYIICECGDNFPNEEKLRKHIENNHDNVGEEEKKAPVFKVTTRPRINQKPDVDDSFKKKYILMPGQAKMVHMPNVETKQEIRDADVRKTMVLKIPSAPKSQNNSGSSRPKYILLNAKDYNDFRFTVDGVDYCIKRQKSLGRQEDYDALQSVKSVNVKQEEVVHEEFEEGEGEESETQMKYDSDSEYKQEHLDEHTAYDHDAGDGTEYVLEEAGDGADPDYWLTKEALKAIIPETVLEEETEPIAVARPQIKLKRRTLLKTIDAKTKNLVYTEISYEKDDEINEQNSNEYIYAGDVSSGPKSSRRKSAHTESRQMFADLRFEDEDDDGEVDEIDELDSKEHIYTCEVCGKHFRTAKSINLHMYKVHAIVKIIKEKKPVRGNPKPKNCVCHMCGKKYNSNAALSYHMRNHTGERPFKCTECPKAFTMPLFLQIHTRIHTGERPYTCEHCPKSFTNKTAIMRHNRVHTGEKPYKCPECGKAFTQSNSMKLHVLTVHWKMPAPYKSAARKRQALERRKQAQVKLEQETQERLETREAQERLETQEAQERLETQETTGYLVVEDGTFDGDEGKEYEYEEVDSSVE